MEPWQERVVEEKKALDEKLEKLDAFILSKAFDSVDHFEKRRLHQQQFVMSEYSRILDERIANF
jgi:hypothetical protein